MEKAWLIVPGLLAFFTLGVIQASYGPAFPALQARYGVGSAAVAWIASVHFLGSTFGPVVTGLALTRFSTRRVVNAGLLTLLLGGLGLAFAPVWLAALAGALVVGLGVGVVSAALNTAYARLGTRPSNVVNALYGVGSLLSPLLVAATVSRSLSLPFLAVALLAGLSLLAVWAWNVPEVQRHKAEAAPARPVSPALAIVFSLLLAGYVATEVGFGAWIGRHLESLGGHNPALVVSGFWGGLTLGRVLVGAFGPRFRPERVVLGGVALAALSALTITLVPRLAVGGYLLAGVALGPMFGTSLVWISRVLPPRQVPFMLIAGNIGGVVSPVLVGWMVGAGGPQNIPLTLLLLSVFLLATVMVAHRLTPQDRTRTGQP